MVECFSVDRFGSSFGGVNVLVWHGCNISGPFPSTVALCQLASPK